MFSRALTLSKAWIVENNGSNPAIPIHQHELSQTFGEKWLFLQGSLVEVGKIKCKGRFKEKDYNCVDSG